MTSPRLRAGIVAFVLAFAMACHAPNLNYQPLDAGNINALPSGSCTSDGWCWRNPLPEGEPINAVWGASANDVYAVGNAGTVVNWNGSSWSSLNPPGNADLLAVWGPGNGDVWVVGAGGTILQYNEGSGAWTKSPFMPPAPATGPPDLTSIWGSGTNDMWIVGKTIPLPTTDGGTCSTCVGTVLHSTDGMTWTQDTTDFPIYVNLNGVWESDPDHVWIVGDRSGTQPFVMSNTKGTWTQILFPDMGSDNLLAVSGTGPNDVWVVGSGGAVGNWTPGGEDGGTSDGWNFPTTPASADLTSVWTGAIGDVWAVGAGAAYHAVGGNWSTVAVNVTESSTSSVTENLTGVWGSGIEDVWVVGNPASIQHLSASASTGSSFSATAANLTGAYASPNGTSVRFVGTPGVVLNYTSGSWISEPVGDASLGVVLTAIAGNADDDIWAVGMGGVIAHWGGSSWSLVDSPTSENLWAIGGLETEWAVGDSGTVLQRVGSTWFLSPSGITQKLNAVCGVADNSVWAAGADDIFIHWTGGADSGNLWTVVRGADSTEPAITALWGAEGQIWAAGAHGIYDNFGAGWAPVPMSGSNLLALTGIPGGIIWAVGAGGVAWKFEEDAWTQSNTGIMCSSTASPVTSCPLNLLAATAVVPAVSGGIWAAGSDGLVLQMTH